MNLNDINSLSSFIIKEIKPELVLTKPLFKRLIHSSQIKRFSELLGFDTNQPPYEFNRLISVELSPFKKVMGDKTPELTIDKYGYAAFPDDCYYPSRARYRHIRAGVVNWYDVIILDDKEYEDRVASNLFKPSFQYPIGNIQNRSIRFAPANMKRVYFSYLKLPDYPVYAVTTTRGFQEFDEVNSSVWEWSDISTLIIIQKFLQEINIDLTIESINNYKNQSK